MKVFDTSKPRLPIDRLKHPVRVMRIETKQGDKLTLNGKTGDELEKTVKMLFEAEIKKG